VNGQTYHVQYADSLSSSNWANLGGTITATGTTASANDPVGTDAVRYYRVVKP
jgi:hypothetical protein